MGMDLSAQDAANTLHGLERVEETLTARTAGLSNIVWGLASPLIFLTYGTAAPWVEANNHHWLYALLWIPGVALGSLLTKLLWRQHAVHLRQAPGGDWRMLGYIALFFATATALWFVTDKALQWHWTTSALMTVANGFFALMIATVEHRGQVPCARYGYPAGAWMILAGLTIAFAGANHAAASLLGAAATSIGWTLAGLWMIRRG